MENSAEAIGKWIEATEHELAELEKQSYKWWKEAQENPQLRTDLEKTARSVDARIIELWSERARRRAKLAEIGKQDKQN